MEALAASTPPSHPAFDGLPPSVLLSIVLLLPRLVDRVRVSLVSKRWAALLTEPALYADVSFEGAKRGRVSGAVLLQLARRASGRLRSLDVSATSFFSLIDFKRLVADMAAEGLTGTLTSLSAPGMRVSNAEDALALRKACPALTTAAIRFQGEFPDVFAAMRALALGGGSTAELGKMYRGSDGTTFASFAAGLAYALALCPVDTLQLGEDDGVGMGGVSDLTAVFSARPDAAAAEAAAARLGSALEDSQSGPRALRVLVSGRTTFVPFPAPSHLLRSLTPQSPLRELTLNSGLDAETLGELAAVLGPGRSNIESVEIGNTNLTGSEGIAFLRAAIDDAGPVRSLSLCGCDIGGQDGAAAVAALLRGSTALRKLSLTRVDLGGSARSHLRRGGAGAEGGAALIFAALGGQEPQEQGGGAQQPCGITELELKHCPGAVEGAAAAALGRSLRRGARLERLSITFVPPCGMFGDDDVRAHCGADLAGEIADALVALGPAARLRDVSFENVAVGDRGLQKFAQALQQPGCSLEALSLFHCNITAARVPAVADALEANAASSRFQCLSLIDLRFHEAEMNRPDNEAFDDAQEAFRALGKEGPELDISDGSWMYRFS